jgi:nickel transport protein
MRLTGFLRLVLQTSTATLVLLLLHTGAFAHKVSVFAYVDGPNIVIDAFYSKSNKVVNGKIRICDAATGEEFLHTATDEKGALTVPVPAKAMADAADLRIRLDAGEGHQAETIVKADEYASLRRSRASKPQTAAAPAPAATAPKGESKASAASPQQRSADPPPTGPMPSSLDEAALSRIVEQAVDKAMEARLAPVKRLLLESAEHGPGLTEVVGGIGYIVGLFGVAAFVASRRGGRAGK